MKNRGRHYIFIRFLLSYLLILLIPLCIGSLLYQRSLRLVEEDAQHVNLAMLDQSKYIMDQRLSEIDNLITQIALNSKIKNILLQRGSIEENIYQIRDTWRELSSYTITNSFVSKFFIYFKNPDIILSPYTTYIRLPLFYGDTFQYNQMDYAQFNAEYLNQHHHRKFMPSVPVMMDGKTQNMILGVQSIPIEYPSEYQGNIMFFIEEDEIHKSLASLQIENGGWVYIADNEGRIITCFSSSGETVAPIDLNSEHGHGFLEHTISDEKMIISYTTSSYNGWTYVAGLPYAMVMARVQYVRQLMWITILLSVVGGVLIAYLLAYANTKPLKDIISSLNGFYSKGNRNDYDLLKGSVFNLIDNYKAMEDAVQKHKPLLQAGFLDRLYRAEFSDSAEMKAVLDQTGWDITAKAYAVLIIQINGSCGNVSKEAIETLNMKRVLIRETLTDMFKDKAYLHNIDIDKVALLLCFDTDNDSISRKNTEEVMGHAKALLMDKYEIDTTISASAIHNNLQDAYFGFDEAKKALVYQIADEACDITWYQARIIDNGIHHFPMDLELKLVNCVRTGDAEKTEKLYKELYVENFLRRNLSPEMRWQFLYELRGTLLRMIDEIYISHHLYDDLKSTIIQIHNGKGLGEANQDLLETFIRVCNAVQERKKGRDTQIKDRMIAYIRDHYMDSGLCLNRMSEEFEVTELYLSQFFKDQTGENFGSYLEQVRMDKAYSLLCSTELSIDDIAAETGYNSAHAFRRAFKRFHGIVPTACRDTAKEQTIKTQQI